MSKEKSDFMKQLRLFGAFGVAIALLLNASSCIFNNDALQVNIINTDSLGVAVGEIGFISSNQIHLVDPNGTQYRQVTNTSDTKTTFKLRGNKNQAIYMSDDVSGFPRVINFNNGGNVPNFSSTDFAFPVGFGYTAQDTFYFLTRSANRFKSTSANYTAYIQQIISPHIGVGDSVKGFCISTQNDVALSLKTASNEYKLCWIEANQAQTPKIYQDTRPITQLFFDRNSKKLSFLTPQGVFVWSKSNTSPKIEVFDTTITHHTINPVGTEIAYTKGTNEIYVRNLTQTKFNRKISSPTNSSVSAIDWK